MQPPLRSVATQPSNAPSQRSTMTGAQVHTGQQDLASLSVWAPDERREHNAGMRPLSRHLSPSSQAAPMGPPPRPLLPCVAEPTLDLVDDDIAEIQAAVSRSDDDVDTGTGCVIVEHENPYSEAFLSDITSSPNMRDMVASYIYSRSVSVVRKHARSIGAKQNKMNRAQLRGHVFAVAAAKVRAGGASWDNVLGPDFVQFVTDPRNQTMIWHESPTDAALEAYKPVEAADRRRGASARISSLDENESSEPPLNLSEFGRLVCVLLQLEFVRRDLMASGLDLSRAQSDRHEGRDEFWSKSVSPAFNSPAIRVSLCAEGYLSDVNVNAPPRAHREGEKLKSIFFKSRGLFTKSYGKWSLSGQNDPERFADFLPRGPRSTEISTEGKRALLLFVALKCGTSEEDTDALNFTKKLAPDGVGFDDMDSCSSGDRDEARRPAKRSRSGVSAAASGVGTKGIQDESMERFGNMLADAMKPILEMVRTRPSVPTTAAPASTGDIDVLLQKLEEVAEKLQAVYDREENHEARIADQYLKIQLEKRLEIIQRDIEKCNTAAM
jgi:hypothetical protein